MTGIDKEGASYTDPPGAQDLLKLDSRRLLTVVLEHLSDGFLFTDPNGLVMLTNPALEQMLGRPATVLLGKPLAADMAPGIGPIIGQALETAPEPASGEIVLDDGRQIQVSASAVEGGEALIGVVTTLRDVSRHRAAEQAKDTLLTAISHELRTPLASIVGFAALADKTLHERLVPYVSPEAAKAHRALARIENHLQRIEESGRQLEQMVNDLLDLADMEAGRLEWHMMDVGLVDVIHAAMLPLISQSEAKSLPIRLSLAPDMPAARGDRVRLTQVVTNLLSNAIRFTEQGEIRVSAKALKIESREGDGGPGPLPPGNYLLVSVADTGRGIAPESLPRLFEKFFQPGDSLTDKSPGAGLGLALCREIIEHHGGHIWAESKPGKGSTFSFALPWDGRARPARPILLRELRRWLALATPESTTPVKVLVAHTNADLQQVVERSLSSEDWTLLLASDGKACRRILEADTPPLLVLDPFLPHLDALSELSLPLTLLLAVVEGLDGGLRVALGETIPEFSGLGLALHSLPSPLALAWDEARPEGRILILDASAPSLGGITETLRAQGFEPIVSRSADPSDPDQAILEAALAFLRPMRIQSTARYRNARRELCTVLLVES